MLGLRDYLRRRAAWVWNEQGHAFNHGLALQEETLTEMLLLRMARDHAKHGLGVTLFTKHEEKRNGADWEWFVQTPTCEIALRIQAKRLYHADKGGDYGGLGTSSQQAQKLISRASEREPLFVFFNHDHGKNSHLLNAGGEAPFIGRSFWGCSVAPAKKVVAINSNKLSDLRSVMTPWHNLVTPSGTCGLDAAISPSAGKFVRLFSENQRRVVERIWDREFLNQYVMEKELAGVAVLNFRDFRGG